MICMICESPHPLLLQMLKIRFKEHKFWDNVLWTDSSKFSLFVHSYASEPKKTFEQKNLTPTAKHGGENVYFGAACPGFTIIESTMNSSLYEKVLEVNLRSSVNKTLSWSGGGPCNMTMTKNISVNPTRNGSEKRNGEFLNGQVKTWMLILLRYRGVIWNRLCKHETPQSSHS